MGFGRVCLSPFNKVDKGKLDSTVYLYSILYNSHNNSFGERLWLKRR
jgi:hypothetical protein